MVYANGMDAINKSTFLAVGMQLWNVLVFGAVQEKKHNGLWEGDNDYDDDGDVSAEDV
jgi:hypothetical protein